MQRIGVRELRQHASRYLALVAGGERIEVTDRGRPVALLVPPVADPWAAMIEAGRITPPTSEADLGEEASADYGIDASTQLAALRDEER